MQRRWFEAGAVLDARVAWFQASKRGVCAVGTGSGLGGQECGRRLRPDEAPRVAVKPGPAPVKLKAKKPRGARLSKMCASGR